ncbi:MAG: hypothetical protein ACRDL6_13090 [Solirubrobacterales bacterium]
MRRPRRLLVPGVITAGAAVIAVGVLLDREDRGGSPRPGAEEALGLSDYPDLGRCVDPGAGAGKDDEGLEVDEIAAKVERLRGLRFSEPPEVELLEADELESRLREDFDQEIERSEVEIDQRTLTLLGALPEDQDLYGLYRDAFAEQVAGVYDQRTGELLVLAGEEEGALERITLAHELEHALADQALGLPIADDPDLSRADSLLARTALVEGDATLTMELYLVRHVGLGDLLGTIDAGIFGTTEQDLAELPYVLQQELLWPYVAGAEFVCHLYARGGWRAIDRAYESPPASSDQIIFPGRYGESVGDPRDPPPLQGPWTRLARTEFGAAHLLWLLEAPGDDPGRGLPRPRALVEPWRGGELTLWKRGAESAAGIALLERGRSGALCAAVSGWYSSAFPDAARRPPEAGEGLVAEGEGQSAVIRCPPGEVRVGIAPTLSVARRLAS